ncbi:MAG TPA: flagellar hook assembly protein FlgD [Bacillales bacterium]|nr:flagellar hook assembly protein FlgD [Bacillales bacterium]
MIERTSESLYLQQANASGATQQRLLGKDDFLRLLITQLKHQSPLQPMKNREFISQMAKFSTLEQMTNLNNRLDRFLTQQNENPWLTNAELIGKEVTWLKNDGETGEGIIHSIRMKDGQIWFETKEGTLIGKNQITEIGLSSVDGEEA